LTKFTNFPLTPVMKLPLPTQTNIQDPLNVFGEPLKVFKKTRKISDSFSNVFKL